jgi:hypothetical protein
MTGLRSQGLLRRLTAIREPVMRSARVAEILAGDPEAAVIFLHHILAHSGGADPGVAAALDATGAALTPDRLSYRQRAALYAAAVDRADLAVARLFFDVLRPDSKIEAIEAGLEAARPLTPRSRPLSLGERKSLARGPRSERLLQLLSDPHPDVVEILLGNPHLTESDVLTMAARRPTLPRCQELISASDRWRQRYRVRRALVLNPYTPTARTLLLIATLGDKDLAAVASDANLPPALREQATAVATLRSEHR